jgi:hypothetical protein
MITVQFQYTVNPDNSLTWGEFRVSPSVPVDDSVIADIYQDIVGYINGNPSIFNAATLNTYCLGSPAIAILDFCETFSYLNGIVAKLPESVSFVSVNSEFVDPVLCGW